VTVSGFRSRGDRGIGHSSSLRMPRYMFSISGGGGCRCHRTKRKRWDACAAFDLIHKRSGGDFLRFGRPGIPVFPGIATDPAGITRIPGDPSCRRIPCGQSSFRRMAFSPCAWCTRGRHPLSWTTSEEACRGPKPRRGSARACRSLEQAVALVGKLRGDFADSEIEAGAIGISLPVST